MKFVEVKTLPPRKHGISKNRNKKKPMRARLEEFMKTDIKMVRVEFDSAEYKSTGSAKTSLYSAINTGAFPISVKIRGNDVYLIRKDI